MTRPWFRTTDSTTLEIRQYRSISDHKVIRVLSIDDVDAIRHLRQRIERMPTDGEKSVSWGADADHIDLVFHADGYPAETVAIVHGHFKAPSNGFNPVGEEAASLYADIKALLYPTPGKRLLKIKDLALGFEGFSLTYLGNRPSAPAPVTVSWSTDLFRVNLSSGKEQRIEIVSGQRPPSPYPMDVGTAGFTLLTYQTGSGERLFPDYVQVIERPSL